MSLHRMRSAACAGRRRGLTIVELLISLAIIGMVGAAVAMMLMAVTYGTEIEKDRRTLVVKQKTIAGRLGASIRGSHMILAHGTDYVILWIFDANENDAPNLKEIRRIEFHSGTGELRSYMAPASLSEAANTPYALTDNFNSITNAIKGSANFPLQLWAQGVTTFSSTLDKSDPQDAKLLSYRLTLNAGDLTLPLIGAASLRGIQDQ